MNKNYNIVELLHSITQKGIKIEFSDDFEYGITVAWGDKLEEHAHITNCTKGNERQKLQNLEKEIANLLANIDAGLE